MSADRPTLVLEEGRTYDPFVAPQKDGPHPIWRHARESAPVFWSDIVGAWVISSYEAVSAVLADPDSYINADATRPLKPAPPEVQAILAEGLPAEEVRSPLALDRPEHTRIKKFLLAAVTPHRINKLDNRAYEVANDLVNGIIDDGKAEFVSQFAYRMPLTLLLEMIGIPVEHGDQLHQWSSQKMSLQWGSMDLEEHKAAARGYVEFQMYLKDLVEQRRARPHDDMVSAFTQLRQQDERPLTDAEIVGQMMGVIAAGHETTMNFLAITLWHALENREIWEAVCANKSLAPALVEEGLRFDSPSQSLWRTTTREVDLVGVKIPAGEKISLLIGSANRDARAFAEADRFDLSRKGGSQHLSFGRGLHFCVGAALSRLEGRVTFEVLSQRIPSMRLAKAARMSFKPNATQRFLETVPIEWDVPVVR